MLGVDCRNAYGMFLRSAALGNLRKELPSLAGIAYAEWQNVRTLYWQRVGGEWKKGTTARGGFQGSPLTMVEFCCSLRFSVCRMCEELRDGFQKPAYQDDNYMVGKVKQLAQH